MNITPHWKAVNHKHVNLYTKRDVYYLMQYLYTYVCVFQFIYLYANVNALS